METMRTLALKIDNLEKGQEKQGAINNEIFMKLDSKVSYKYFTWILGILLTITVSILGYIAVRVDSQSSDITQVKTQVSYINGVFKSMDLKVEK